MIEDYMHELEKFIVENYRPADLNRETLRQLGEMTDILKDLAAYCMTVKGQ